MHFLDAKKNTKLEIKQFHKQINAQLIFNFEQQIWREAKNNIAHEKSQVYINQKFHKEFNEYAGPLTLLDRYQIASASYRFSNIHRSYEGGKTGQSSGISLIKF